MDQIIENFGIQPLLLAAQAVNFFILLFLLQKFLYKPILKVLHDRKAKIAQSLKDAEEIEQRLQKISAEQEKRINEAMEDARKIVAEANKSAEEIIHTAGQKAAEDAKKMMERAQATMKAEGEQLRSEIRAEVGDLVALSLKKFFAKNLTEKDRKELVESSVENLS